MADTTQTTEAAKAAPTPVADAGTKILKQVNYYFSDSNFPKDKFLREKAKQNPQGYIPLQVLTTFNRLKELTTDVAVIADALKASEIVELNEDKTMIKRRNPLPEDDTSLPRSIYSKGWPQGTTIEKVAEFYAPYGKVLSVHLRRVKTTKDFKGSLTVEFSTEDEAKAALAAAPQMEGHTITHQTKESWAQEKRDAFQAKKQKKKEQKEQKQQKEKPGEKRKADDGPQDGDEESYPRGTIISFKGVGEGVNRFDLKPVFAEYGDVAYVDFQDKAVEGLVRYKTAEDASKALKELTESKREFGGSVPTLVLLEGEEEKKYWDVVAASSKAQGKRGGRGGRGGKGGRGRGGKGRGGKKQKTG
jgi:lupus La protein